MRKTSVFENFIKIAEEQDLIPKDAPAKAKKKLEQNPRWDSLTEKEITKLYNVKPDAPKGSEYKNNIIERAHPTSAVVSSAHDKINGLVENENERQTILLNILSKNPNGNLSNKKLAHQDLMLALVRVGNDLDNNNEHQLRALADACLTQLSIKTLKKTALAPALFVVPALIGSLYLQQHLPFVNDGFEKNHEKLIAEIDDLLNSNDNFGVGYQYKPEFIATIQDLKNKLIEFYNLYKKVEPVISSLEKPRTAKELLQLSQEPQSQSVIKSYNALKSAAANMLPLITTVQKDFSNENYKNRQIQEKGFLTSLVDKTQVLHGGKGLVADDFDDVARAIPPYLQSIKDLSTLLTSAGSIQEKAQSDLNEAAYKSEELLGGNKPSTTSQETQQEKINIHDLDNQAEDLEKELADLV